MKRWVENARRIAASATSPAQLVTVRLPAVAVLLVVALAEGEPEGPAN